MNQTVKAKKKPPPQPAYDAQWQQVAPIQRTFKDEVVAVAKKVIRWFQ